MQWGLCGPWGSGLLCGVRHGRDLRQAPGILARIILKREPSERIDFTKSQDHKVYEPLTPSLQSFNPFMQFGPHEFSLCDPRATKAPLIVVEEK